MKVLNRIVKIAGLALLVANLGCSRQAIQIVRTDSVVPEIVCGMETEPSIEQLDPKMVVPENNGYVADMNNDGTNDFSILYGVGDKYTLYFAKDGNRNSAVPVLTLSGNLIAYRIGTIQGVSNPSLIYFLPNGKGYIRKNLGANNGIPYFGKELELEKADER